MTKDWPFASKRHEALTQAARHAMQRAEDLRVSDPEDAAEWLQVASELDPGRADAGHQARLAADDFHVAVCTGPGVPAGFTCSHPSHARLAAEPKETP